MKTETNRLTLLRRSLLSAVASLCLCGPGLAKGPNVEPNADPDAELERQHFVVPDGYVVNLFASDPMIVKPVEMNFDPAGRLWVATSETYPQVKPGNTANDKVIVLEDTTGSGTADRSTVFAEGLLIPTGIAPGDGGCYVANSTEIDFLRNSKFDGGATAPVGKADIKRVMLAGFGTEDTHHIVHAFRWGPDGRLYFNQSIYIHSTLETPHGIRRLYGGGVWRLEPSTMNLDVFVTGLVNGWGDVWDRWGNAFGTDGAGGEGINFFIPGAAFTATPNTSRFLAGLNPGSPKYASIEVLSGRAMPEDVQGSMITNDFRASRIVRFKLSDSGAGYVSKLAGEFLTSSDRAFRPVDVKMGPDGALYIADWYNPIINHGEVDFRDPRRDHSHGRIWRMTSKSHPVLARPKLVGAPVTELLGHLLDPEQWTRQNARLVLRERGAEQVAPALAAWVDGLDKLKLSAEDLEHARLEALWTYECIDTVNPALLDKVLQSSVPDARGSAALVVSHWLTALPDPAALLTPLLSDEAPRVRLMAVRALSAIGTPEIVPLSARVLDKPMDPFLDYALFKTCTDLEPVWMPANEAGKLNWKDSSHLAFALRAVRSPAALKVALKQLKNGELSADARRNVFDLVASSGADADVKTMLDATAFATSADDATRASALSSAEHAVRDRHLKPKVTPAEIRPLIEASNADVASAASRLAGVLKIGPVLPSLETLARGASTPMTVRLAAVTALAEIGKSPGASEPFFSSLNERANPPEVRAGGVVGLASVNLKDASAKAAEWLATVPPGTDVSSVISAFLHRDGGADLLAAGLKNASLSADSAKLSLRYLQSVGQSAPALSALLTQRAGVATLARQLSPDEMKLLIDEVASKGDPARGELVFRSKTAGCYQCHAIGGAGGSLAPDLRAIGSSPADYIVNSIILPNKDIKDGFDSIIVTTRDGDLVQGIKVREDKKELVLRDNSRDEIVIAVPEIAKRKPGGSLMPSGLADPLTHQEFVDLLRFLVDLGKPGPYAVADAPVIRTWRVLSGTQWYPAYSLVSGELPADAWHSPGSEAIVTCQIEMSAPGKVRLSVNDPAGLSLSVDGKSVGSSADHGAWLVDLSAGRHEIAVRIGAAQRGSKGLRVEVSDTGSASHVQPVGGK